MYPVPQETAPRRLWWVAAGLGIALMLATTAALWHFRRAAIDDQARELRLLSLAFAEASSAVLRGAEEGLRTLRLELHQHRLAVEDPGTVQALRTRAALIPLAQAIWVVSADGRVIVASDPAAPAPDPVVIPAALDQLREDATSISRPFSSDSGSRSLVALAVRIVDAPSGN
jgi:hypothetical protein